LRKAGAASRPMIAAISSRDGVPISGRVSEAFLRE
jgi:hypothetical protein